MIIRKWVHVGLEDKKFLLNKLKQFVSLQRDVSSFILKKNIKLIVDVARSDWPHSYPEFFSDIINVRELYSLFTLMIVIDMLFIYSAIDSCFL